MVELTRRGFLAGLLGATVIVVVPKAAQAVIEAAVPEIDPWAIMAPPGITYNWVTCAVMGEPTDRFVEDFLSRGWKFVEPAIHPGAPVMTAEKAIGFGGLILMEKPTVEVEKWRREQKIAAQQRFPMMMCKVCRTQVNTETLRPGTACSDVNAQVLECPGCFNMRPWWKPCTNCHCGTTGRPHPNWR